VKDEFRVEADLDHDEREYSLRERLRTLDLDDDARTRLGSRVIITRDGNRMQLYTHTLADAKEAERTVGALVTADALTADFTISRWSAEAQEWVDPVGGDVVIDLEPDAPTPDPSYVILEAYKPEFLRDLGL
jgi:hypothetical protein